MSDQGAGGFIVEYTITSTDLVAASSTEEALETVRARRKASAVRVVAVTSWCSRCGGFADASEARKLHRMPGCRGRWRTPAPIEGVVA